jgi:hypothetical protein
MIAAIILSGSGSVKDLHGCFTGKNEEDSDYTFVEHSKTSGDEVTASASSPKRELNWVQLAKCPVVVSGDGEAARGGAVLSAAELESCKQYLELENGESTLAYAVSRRAATDRSIRSPHVDV